MEAAASGELLRNIWSVLAPGIGFLSAAASALRLLANGLSQLSSKLTDTTAADGAQYPASGADPAGHPVVRIDESAKLFLVALGVFFPIYLNTPARHPHRRSAIDRDGVASTHEQPRIVPPRDLSRRAAVDLVGLRFALASLWLTLIVAETIRASSGLAYGDAGARVHADRRRVALDPDLRLLGKLADSASRRWSG